MEDTYTNSSIAPPIEYTIELNNQSGDISTLSSLTRVLYIVILFVAFIVILLHVIVGVSMLNTIFLFILYGILLMFISYIQYRYITKEYKP